MNCAPTEGFASLVNWLCEANKTFNTQGAHHEKD